jgi:hypothetical protein
MDGEREGDIDGEVVGLSLEDDGFDEGSVLGGADP